ncbi:GTPase-associated protein 1-related protein [Streptomyces sp. NBC_00838]|uniref:GTPase-associated protein 1-related protein n=1 Tax=Streptomyces sp. NBC_00838 TaxID=2903680 RepID=UPI003862F27B|nr:GTPase-associated protein 1-related protein [Streptomyces sp. NBC_00838]
MVIRRLSYLLDREPDTGSVRLQPRRSPEPPHSGGEGGAHGGTDSGAPDDLLAQVEQIITLTHRRTPHGALSCSRLPDGGSLLCDGREDGERPGESRQFIEAVHLPSGADGFDRVWPIDTWRSRSWDTPAPAEGHGDPLPTPEGHLDLPLLVRFAREQASRVAPFLADVRRLWADPAGRQIVIAEEDPETVVRWIALACASLPEQHARALTFVTRADEPHDAPQQIVGIGPDSSFDRHDPLLVEHLYRVHDGLGGPGSPHVPDTWAELTAALWQAGAPPTASAAGTAGAGDPFAPAVLVRQLLRTGTASGDGLTTLHQDSLRAVVDTLARTVQDRTQDSPAIEELTRVCQELGKHCGDGVTDALALALVRRRLAAALAQDTATGQDPLVGLPLGEAARRSLRSEFGLDFDKGLVRRIRGPVATWAEPLHLALVLHGDQGPGVEDAVNKLVRVLLQPRGRECADAVTVLKTVGHQGLNRRVLARIAVETAGRRSHLLRELLRSPHGEWVRAHRDIAPPSVRLVEQAVWWGGPPHHLRGIDLFAKLAEPAPGAAVSPAADPPTLETLWALVWGADQPERPDFPRIIRICGAEAVLGAGLGTRFLAWLTSPGRFDQELVDFARAVHRRPELTKRERAIAQLLALADDFARTSQSPREVVDRVDELRRAGSPLDAPLWDGVQYLLARGLAGLSPHELYQSGALSFLATAEPALQRHYRAAVVAEFSDDAKVNRMAAQPEAVADLFCVWRRELNRTSRDWPSVVDELLRHTLGVVVRRMNDEQRGAVATRLAGRSNNWVQNWLRWTNGVGDGADTRIPGRPAPYPPGQGRPPGGGHVPGQPPPPRPGELPAVPPEYPSGYSPTRPPR